MRISVGIFSLLGLVGLSLGCGKSPSGPTSLAAVTSPAISVTAVSPTAGLIGDAVRVTGTGFLSGAALTLGGVVARVTSINNTVIVATTPVHLAGTVDVVVTNPDGQSGTVTEGYTFQGVSLMASPSVVTSGSQLTMSWVAPSGRGCNGGGDWVAIFRIGDPDITGAANGHSDLWFNHLCGATSGSSTLSAPREPGHYEFRYMVGDTGIARSGPVTVNASTAPSPLVPTLTVDGGTASNRQLGQTFWVSGNGYTPGQTVTRYISPAVNGSTELMPLTADGSGNLSWAFTPTCDNFNPKNTVAIYAVDTATGRSSNSITESVTGSCP